MLLAIIFKSSYKIDIVIILTDQEIKAYRDSVCCTRSHNRGSQD